MQGQRGMIGSLPEILEFDHGSSSGHAAINQQLCWNVMPNPAENRLADFMLPPSHINITHIISIDQERRNLSGWSLGEPSSSRATVEAGCHEQKPEHAWSASASGCTGAGPRLEERVYEPANSLSLDSVNVNSQFVQSFNTNAIPQNLNLNAGFVGHGGDLESSKSGKAENDGTRANGSDTFLHPPGSGGFVMEENDGRLGSSLDGRRLSCKRKAAEGHTGQSSMSERPGFFQCSENSAWAGFPARYDPGNSLSISAPFEHVNPRLGLGVGGLASDSIPDLALAGLPEASQRNSRLRINPSNQDSISPPLFSTGNAVRLSNIASSHDSSRPADHSLSRSSLVLDGAVSQTQPVLVPTLPQNVQPFRWSESSSSRNGSASGSINLGNREEGYFRSAARNLWVHPMSVPTTELRASVRNPTSVTGGRTSVPGTIASTSLTGSSSSVHPLSARTWASYPNPPSRSSRRLAEYVCRTLFSSANADTGGQSSTHPLGSGRPGSSEDAIIASGVSNQLHHRAYPRSASWMDRQGDGVLGFPYPLRTLAAGEVRSRLLVSEHIRNVLDLMRRGESMRFEDVMIDQSVFLGVPDIHRDMRLDVDNMSYEELLALEERIGNVNTGLSEETISKQLKQHKYSAVQKGDVEAEPCCVCQEKYNDGENIGTLDCGHDYHRDCIKQWLMLKNWCPICKTTGLAR